MLLQIDSKQEVKWATVLFPPDIDDIIYCSVDHTTFSPLNISFGPSVLQKAFRDLDERF